MVIRFLKKVSSGFLSKLGRKGRSRDDTCEHAQAGRESPAEHPFSADRPITLKSEDKLNRANFAVALADAISKWEGRDSLVVGLFGPWGVGKTSIINLARARIADKHANTTVVDFNPWEWAGHEELATALLKEIELVLSREADRSVIGKLRAYISILEGRFTLADRFLRRVENAVSASVLVATLIGSFFISDTATRAAALFGGSFIAGLAQIRGVTSRVADSLAGDKTIHKTLNEAKQDLRDALSKSGRQLLIVVDDIDRLTPPDTIRIFQVIKANADLPNLVFLLAFDQHVVAKSVSDTLHVVGQHYVEKIVQVGFDVPAPDQFDLASLLEAGITRATMPPPIDRRLDNDRLRLVYNEGLNTLISTPRQVARFSSMLEFQLRMHVDGDECNVDPVDFIALEAIRECASAVYGRLVRMKPMLTRTHFSDDADRQEAGRRLQAVLDLQKEFATATAVGSLMRLLFPSAKVVLDGYPIVPDRNQLLRDRRVAHEDVFDRYFQLTIPTRDLSEREIAGALNLAVTDRRALADVLRNFIGRELIDVFLGRIRVQPEQVPADATVGFVTGLFDVGDDLDEPEAFSFGGIRLAANVVKELLEHTPQPDRADLMRAAIEATGGLALAVDFARLEGYRGRKGESQALDAATLEEVQARLAKRIQELAEEGSLRDHRHLVSLLWGWDEWAPGEASAWVEEESKSKDGMLRLIEAFRGIGSSDFDHPLGRFLDLNSAQERQDGG